jgi:Fe-S-cluster containining protein
MGDPNDLPGKSIPLKVVQIVDGKINFACLRGDCPNSCCGPFGGVQRGIDSIEGREFSEIALTDDDVRRLLAAGFSNLIELTQSGHYRMRLLEDGTCTALNKEGRCSIHSIKPTLCRAFPFYVDMFVGLCAVTECPGFGSGWTNIENLQGEIMAAKKMYSFWLDRISPQGKPEAAQRDAADEGGSSPE